MPRRYESARARVEQQWDGQGPWRPPLGLDELLTTRATRIQSAWRLIRGGGTLKTRPAPRPPAADDNAIWPLVAAIQISARTYEQQPPEDQRIAPGTSPPRSAQHSSSSDSFTELTSQILKPASPSDEASEWTTVEQQVTERKARDPDKLSPRTRREMLARIVARHRPEDDVPTPRADGSSHEVASASDEPHPAGDVRRTHERIAPGTSPPRRAHDSSSSDSFTELNSQILHEEAETDERATEEDAPGV